MVKKIILILIIWSLIDGVQAQEQNKLGGTIAVKKYFSVPIQPIINQLKNANDDTAKVGSLMKLCSYYYYRRSQKFNDLDSVLIYAKKAKEISESLKYKDGVNEANFLFCKTYAAQNNVDKALPYLSVTAKDQQIRLLIVMGEHYLYLPGETKSNLAKAFPYLSKANGLSDVIRSPYWKNESLAVLGKYYFENGEFAKGEKSFLEIIGFFKKAGNKSAEAHWWEDLGRYSPDNDSTFMHVIASLQNSRNLYHEINDLKSEEGVLEEIGEVYEEHHQYAPAVKHLEIAANILTSLKIKNHILLYLILAETNYYMGNLDKALYYNFGAIKNMEEFNDSHRIFFAYLSIGEIYQQIGQHENSIKYYKLALDNVAIINDLYNYFICKNICQELILQGKPRQALAFLSEFIAKKPPVRYSDQESIAIAFGDCYQALKQFDLAEKYYLKMIALDQLAREQVKNEILQQFTITGAPAYYTITKFYVRQKRFNLAAKYLQRALTVSIPPPALLKDIKLLEFKIDSASGNYIPAINSYEQHIVIKDSIFNDSKIKQLAQLQVSYQTTERLKDIQLLQGEKKLQTRQLEQSAQAKKFYVAGIIMLFGILGLGFSRYRIKQQNNKLLVGKNAEISVKNSELERLLRDNDWLMKEVHHRVKNNLQIVMSLLSSQSAYLQDEAALNAVLESQHRVQAMSLIHQKLYRSDNISHIFMPEYIKELIDYLINSFKVRQEILFELTIDPMHLDVLHAVPIGLILNEAITNAIKYGFPYGKDDRIIIRLNRTASDEVSMIIADNGRGLPLDFDIHKKTSFGLALMNGLIEELGGVLKLESLKGTAISFAFKTA